MLRRERVEECSPGVSAAFSNGGRNNVNRSLAQESFYTARLES